MRLGVILVLIIVLVLIILTTNLCPFSIEFLIVHPQERRVYQTKSSTGHGDSQS